MEAIKKISSVGMFSARDQMITCGDTEQQHDEDDLHKRLQ